MESCQTFTYRKITMNKIFTISLLSITLFLTGCQSATNLDYIIKNSEPTYVNIEKINKDSQIFINKDELYVLTDDDGLANNITMKVEDKNIVFVIPQSSSKENTTVYVFIGQEKGSTEATLTDSDGSQKKFILNVN